MHTAEPLLPELCSLKFKKLFESWKVINRQALIIFRQNWFKKEVIH